MRVFLDIGAHVGQTVAEAAKRKYAFDRIVCFEPASVCIPMLEALREADPRIEICPFGLGDRNRVVQLYGAGGLGASVFECRGDAETIELVDVAKWFRENLLEGDFVVVKTNCEGGEIDIVNRLLDESLFSSIVSFLITFDIRNYPTHQHKEIELRRRLAKSPVKNYCFSDDAMMGTRHERGIAHWLHLFGVDRPELSRDEVRDIYRANFRKYAAKSGRRQRIEHWAKQRFNYHSFPEPVKSVLRSLKHNLGLDQTRDLP